MSKNPYSAEVWKKSKVEYSALYHNDHGALLPHGVRILTLETTNTKNEVLLRLENYFEKNENPFYSNSTKVDLRKIINDFTVVSFVEVNLSANQLLKDKHTWKWNTKDSMGSEIGLDHQFPIDVSFEVALEPMQIRTFILTVNYKE